MTRFFKALNGKQVALPERLNVTYIEESDIDGKLVSNIHFDNGRWVTVAHSCGECVAIFKEGQTNEEKNRIEKWKEQARARKEAQIEIEAVKDKIFNDVNKNIDGWTIEENGGFKIYTIKIQLNPNPTEKE